MSSITRLVSSAASDRQATANRGRSLASGKVGQPCRRIQKRNAWVARGQKPPSKATIEITARRWNPEYTKVVDNT